MTPVPHPDLVAAITMVRAAGLFPPIGGDVHAMRDFVNRVNAFTGRTSVPLALERLFAIAVNGRDVPCKLYWPDGAERPPLMFYCHGGGFRHGVLEGWDAPIRQIARDGEVAVLSIGYALSPEHKFPTAFNEIVKIMSTVIEASALGSRSVSGFAAGGDSAGANLALAASIALRDAGIDALRYLMLLYGVYSRDLDRSSWQRLSGFGGQGLSIKAMATYWDSYLGDAEADWRAEPLLADLTGLPPARIIVGDLDPLVDENVVLAEKLQAAGVATTLTILPGITHGVMRLNEVAPVVRALLADEAAALKRRFAASTGA